MTNFIINFGKTDILFLFAMIPSIIIGIIIYKKDLIEKEPIKLLLKLFVFGILSAGIALFFEIYIGKIFEFALRKKVIGVIINSFVLIALCEELTKWIFTYKICWKEKEFNYEYDAIVYAVFISLGFATIENILVILSNDGNLILAIKRALITVPAHAFFGIVSGYYLGKAKKYENKGWKKRKSQSIILSISLPIFIHGLFDYLIFISDKIPIAIPVIFIIYLYYSSISKVLKMSKDTKKITKE